MLEESEKKAGMKAFRLESEWKDIFLRALSLAQ
jgi:hypothetical protein